MLSRLLHNGMISQVGKSVLRPGETKWLMRQAKLRGWGNRAIRQPFKLALCLNFPFLSLLLLHFRSFVLRNALFLCLLSPLPRIRRTTLPSTRLSWGLGV